jgi:PKD repeat protein
MIEDNHVRFQNPNSATPAAKVVTIAFDNADNISPEFSETFNIDWTKPDTISALTVIPDISSNLISATWNAATDQHSDVVSYWYSVGNVAGQDNLIAWTDNSLNLSVTDIYFNFLPNSITYFNVKSQNGAGLFSDIKSSEGIINGEPPTCNADFSADQTTIKVCDTVIFTDISTVSGTTITTREWSFQAGDPLTSNAEYQNVIYSQSGTYDVTLSITTSSGCTDTETKSGFIVVEDDISFNDIMVEDIKIYPNPNNGKFVIDFSAIKYENQRVNYKLIDDLGRIVFEKNEQLNSPKININEQLSNGIYYLILNIDGKNVEKKIAVY